MLDLTQNQIREMQQWYDKNVRGTGDINLFCSYFGIYHGYWPEIEKKCIIKTNFNSLDWKEIQEYYNQGNSKRKTAKHFGIIDLWIERAIKYDWFTTRPRKKYNSHEWDKIQLYANENGVLKTCEKFNFSVTLWYKAIKRGDLYNPPNNHVNRYKDVNWIEVEKYLESHSTKEAADYFNISTNAINRKREDGTIKKCTKETLRHILRKTPKNKHHSGRYKNFWCDSSWELAFLVYHVEHKIHIRRYDLESIEFVFEGKIHHYWPDFIVNDRVIEIKGFKQEIDDYKWSAAEKLYDFKVIYKKEMEKYLRYCKYKYGKDFWNTLYDEVN